jgi:hypothetical protein
VEPGHPGVELALFGVVLAELLGVELLPAVALLGLAG